MKLVVNKKTKLKFWKFRVVRLGSALEFGKLKKILNNFEETGLG